MKPHATKSGIVCILHHSRQYNLVEIIIMQVSLPVLLMSLEFAVSLDCTAAGFSEVQTMQTGAQSLCERSPGRLKLIKGSSPAQTTFGNFLHDVQPF